jgi:hypothetical protein
MLRFFFFIFGHGDSPRDVIEKLQNGTTHITLITPINALVICNYCNKKRVIFTSLFFKKELVLF